MIQKIIKLLEKKYLKNLCNHITYLDGYIDWKICSVIHINIFYFRSGYDSQIYHKRDGQGMG